MTADAILFRCSSLGHIMTESRSKSEPLSETCKTHLIDKYVSEKYGRQTDIQNRYIEKGNAVEEDSITLFSRVTKEFFQKNESKVVNEYICGTPDLYTGERIDLATEIIDIKSSWDIFTYFRSITKELNKMYYWQLQGYMALTGAPTSRLVYCLVNTPDVLMMDEMRRLAWKMGVIDEEANPDYKAACEEIKRNSIYDDIPLSERCYQIRIDRNDSDISRLYQRVTECREWMNKNLFA